MYCTGTGYLEIPVSDGMVAPIPPPYNILELVNPVVKFAGMAGTTLWGGAAPGIVEGMTQVNVQLPAQLPAGTDLTKVSVVLLAENVDSPPVLISVKQ